MAAVLASQEHGLSGSFQEAAKAPWTVVGYSMGGRLALAIAARHPHLVKVIMTPLFHETSVREVATCLVLAISDDSNEHTQASWRPAEG